MAKRPKPIADTEAQAEEEFNQDHPDTDESLEVPESEDNALGDVKKMKKADMVRAAIAAGHATGKPGCAYIKDHFGVDVTPGTFAATKAQISRREGESPSPRAIPMAQAPSALATGGIPPGFGSDVKSLKELIEQVGGAEALKDLSGTIGMLTQKYGVSGLNDLITAFE